MKQVLDNYDRIVYIDKKEKNLPIRQVFIVAKAGSGKSLALERGIYTAWKNNFNVICLSDVKDRLELAFMGFPTEIIEDYHLRKLQQQGISPISVPIKLFHPYTHSIPNRKIPDFRFFTFPITSLGDSEFRLLLESEEDKTTRELLISALHSMKKTDSLWDFIIKIEDMIERKTKQEGSSEIRMPDWDNFGVSGVSLGSIKNLDEIIRIFGRFKQHMILMPENFELNLDVKQELFSNPKEIKIFSTKYINDQKTKDFVLLTLINKIVEEAEYSNTPILIVLDEIKDLIPSGYSRVGYKSILARELSHHLNTSFRANQIASISTSQSFSGVSKNLLRSNAFSVTLIGSIEGDTDLQIMKQVYGYDKDTLDAIQQLNYNEFLVRGLPNLNVESQAYSPYKSLFAPFPHREPYMKFDRYYEKYFYDKMKNFTQIKKMMENMQKEFLNKIKEIKKAKIKKHKEEREEQKMEKQGLEEIKKQLTESEKSKKELIEEKRQEKYDLIWEYWTVQKLTQSQIAQKVGLSQPMINNVIKKYQKLEKEKEITNSDGSD